MAEYLHIFLVLFIALLSGPITGIILVLIGRLAVRAYIYLLAPNHPLLQCTSRACSRRGSG
jgi:hypothetical protein